MTSQFVSQNETYHSPKNKRSDMKYGSEINQHRIQSASTKYTMNPIK